MYDVADVESSEPTAENDPPVMLADDEEPRLRGYPSATVASAGSAERWRVVSLRRSASTSVARISASETGRPDKSFVREGSLTVVSRSSP